MWIGDGVIVGAGWRRDGIEKVETQKTCFSVGHAMYIYYFNHIRQGALSCNSFLRSMRVGDCLLYTSDAADE